MTAKELLMMGALAAGLSSCAYANYFIEEEEVPDDGSYYQLTDLSVSGYNEWIYINLETGEYESHPDASCWYYAGEDTFREAVEEEEITIDWHIATHRYEFKTNGASAYNTHLTDISEVTSLPAGTYQADEVAAYVDEVEKEEDYYLLTMDMSGMMSGNMGYAYEPVINRVLCDAITRTATGSMPPYVYDTEKEVVVLKWDDGRWAKLQVTGLTSSRGTSGYLNFNYKLYNN